jgi:predicted dehydrogenase
MGVAIIGCGNISKAYAKTLASYPEINLLGMTDLDLSRAKALAAEHGVKAYPSIDVLLADPQVELAVNLTIHHAHKEITTQCFEAGKHVYSEKPLALTYKDAQGLVALAKEKGLRLGASPFTHMGEPQQTAWKWIRDGRLGMVRCVFAEVNWARIETWHPNPEPFYDVGPLWDVGVYPLTILTAFFGPARKVSSYGRVLHPDRVTLDSKPFHIKTPDFVVTSIELENGPLVRLTTDFYVGRHSKQQGFEFHGDIGSLYLSDFQNFSAAVEFAEFNKAYESIPLLRPPYEGTEWGRGVREMANAIMENRPHRATGEQAAHIVEILEAISTSMALGKPVEVHSSFIPPAPMEWGL